MGQLKQILPSWVLFKASALNLTEWTTSIWQVQKSCFWSFCDGGNCCREDWGREQEESAELLSYLIPQAESEKQSLRAQHTSKWKEGKEDISVMLLWYPQSIIFLVPHPRERPWCSSAACCKHVVLLRAAEAWLQFQIAAALWIN